MPDAAIIGLRPTGMALAQATRSAFAGAEIVGFDPDKQRTKQAQTTGVFDSVVDRMAPALSGASLVILDTPLQETKSVLEMVGQLGTPSCVVTDTCPLKAPVLRWASELLNPTMGFIGGHLLPNQAPLAGGVANLEGATHCLVTAPDSTSETIDIIVSLAHAARARPLFIEADEHDSFVIATQYLPKLATGAAVDAVLSSNVWRDIRNMTDRPFDESVFPALGSASDDLPLADLSLLGANLDTLLAWLDRLRTELYSLRKSIADDASQGQAPNFEKLMLDRLGRFQERVESGGPSIERPGIQDLVLGDWLANRARRRRGD